MDAIAIIKFISALLYPLGLVVIFALLGFIGRLVFSQGGKRHLANLCCLLSVLSLIVFSNPMVAITLTQALERQHPQLPLNSIQEHDVIIVLGGGLRIPMPPSQHSQLISSSDRYWYAVRLYKAGKASKIILAGGNVYEQDGFKGEAYYAQELMQEWGVPASAILIESESRNTEQNRNKTAQIIAEYDFQSALLVTSAIHMPRAYAFFGQLAIDLTPASADIIVRHSDAPKVFAWMPSVGALSLSTRALHEYYGKWFAQLKALISSA